MEREPLTPMELYRLNEAIMITMNAIRRVAPYLSPSYNGYQQTRQMSGLWSQAGWMSPERIFAESVGEQLGEALREKLKETIQEAVDEVTRDRLGGAIRNALPREGQQSIGAHPDRIAEAVQERLSSTIRDKISEATFEKIRDTIQERLGEVLHDQLQEVFQNAQQWITGGTPMMQGQVGMPYGYFTGAPVMSQNGQHAFFQSPSPFLGPVMGQYAHLQTPMQGQSPLQQGIFGSSLHTDRLAQVLQERLGSSIRDKVSEVVRERLEIILRSRLGEVLRSVLPQAQLNSPFGPGAEWLVDTLRRRIKEEILERVGRALRDKVSEAIYSKVGDVLRSKLQETLQRTIQRGQVAAQQWITGGTPMMQGQVGMPYGYFTGAPVMGQNGQHAFFQSPSPFLGPVMGQYAHLQTPMQGQSPLQQGIFGSSLHTDRLAQVLQERLGSSIRDKVSEAIREDVNEITREMIYEVVRDRLGETLRTLLPQAQLHNESGTEWLTDSLRRQLGRAIQERVSEAILERIDKTIRDKVGEVIRDRMGEALRSVLSQEQVTGSSRTAVHATPPFMNMQ